MDTDAQGNDTQGSNATQDARGRAVDTQGSSTEQMPGADGAEEWFADLLNDVEGNDAKGQGKGNREPDRDDPFEGILEDLGDDDDGKLANFFKDETEQPRKRPAKGNGPEGTLTRSLARSATCASEKDADADDFQLAFPELDNDKKPRKKRKGAPDAECTGQQKKKRPNRRLLTSGRPPRPRKTK